MKDSRKRYIGLDVHKHYLIAIGVDDELNVVLPVRRVELSTRQNFHTQLNLWQIQKTDLPKCWIIKSHYTRRFVSALGLRFKKRVVFNRC